MIWVMVGVTVVAVAVFLAIAAGNSLPHTHTVTVTRLFSAPVEDVWDLVADFERQVRWRPDLTSVERGDDHDGHAVWIETYKGRQVMRFTTLERVEPRRLVRQIIDVRGPFSGRWEIDIEPFGGATQLTITETGRIDNPIARLVMKRVMGEDTYIKSYLDALARHVTGS